MPQTLSPKPSTTADLEARPPMLEVVNATHRYGEVLALDGVTVVARQGEFLTILGESGSGKTTLLRIISGLERPTEAEAIRIGGADVSELGASDRDCTTVFQHYALFPHMSVRENVEYGLKVRGIATGERRKLAMEALELVRLAHASERRIHQLSGGERQRVALARAFVTRPSILLLDEPLGALDEKLRIDMQEELIAIQRNLGITFIYITHSQEEALTMSDRVLLMKSGRIAQEGPPTALFDRPNSAFVARFMGVENILEGVVKDVALPYVTLEVSNRQITGRWCGRSAPNIGARAVAGVRAERVRLADGGQAPDASNGFDCRKTASVYKGKYLDLTLDTPVGPIRSRLWDVDAAPAEPSFIHWSHDTCTVMEP
ncbi:spermidine/putrescine transport system ATP-binding protein [Aquamicrobium terrae]